MSVPKAFGTTLKRYRKKKGWSQEQLALESGHQRVFISWLETGSKQPTITTVFRLAEALGVEPCDLIRGVQAELANEDEK